MSVYLSGRFKIYLYVRMLWSITSHSDFIMHYDVVGSVICISNKVEYLDKKES